MPLRNQIVTPVAMWESYKKGFKFYLQLEKSLADHSVEAYLRDLDKLLSFLETTGKDKSPDKIEFNDLQAFVKWIAGLGMTATSQSRIISGIRSFFKYCLFKILMKSIEFIRGN